MGLEGSGLTYYSLLSVHSFGVTKGKSSANWTLYIYFLNRLFSNYLVKCYLVSLSVGYLVSYQ